MRHPARKVTAQQHARGDSRLKHPRMCSGTGARFGGRYQRRSPPLATPVVGAVRGNRASSALPRGIALASAGRTL